MEKLGFEGLAILLILLPGFLCAGLIQSLCVRPTQTELDKVWEALLYSFVIYVLFTLLAGSSMPVDLRVSETNGAKQFSIQLQPRLLAILMLISVVLALAIGGIATNDLSGKVFRRLRLTQRTTRRSVWSDTFHDYGGIVLVELGDSRRVEGWVRYYSDEPTPASLFLERAAWVTDENTLTPIEGPGILITESIGIQTIEFLRWETQPEGGEGGDAAPG
jgi:hypothetical protein